MLEQTFLHQKQYSQHLRQENLQIRLEHLQDLENAIRQRQEQILESLSKDFSKPHAEALLTEILPVLREIRHTRKNLRRWARPQK